MNHLVIQGDCREILRKMDDESIDCVVTSPPYFQQRVYADFFDDKEIGVESRLDDYVSSLVGVFAEIKRTLKSTGTVFLNLGDKYQAKKQLGVPWKVAFGLMADGWILRNDIIWNKPNPMPSSTRDRFTVAHEYVFFFSKTTKYHFDQVLEPATYAGVKRGGSINRYEQNAAGMDAKVYDTRNKRDVWTIKPATAKGVHSAVFPEDLVEPCIEAGCPIGGLVFDPFAGIATTGVVAKRLGRRFIGSELNPEFVEAGRARLNGLLPVRVDLSKSHAVMTKIKGLYPGQCEDDHVDFAYHLYEVLEVLQREALDFNEAFDGLLSYGVKLKDIRKAEDPSYCKGFDELVQAFEMDPSRFALIGNDEQSIFDTLRRGRRSVPNLRCEEVWEKAVSTWGAEATLGASL